MKCSKGAMWRKWDLHLHTPASGRDYEDQSVTNEQIIETLKNTQISAVAITDHHTINVDRYLDLRELAGGELTVLPGIELRSELGGRHQIHFMAIFPEDLVEARLKDIWTELQGNLKLTPTTIEERGGDEVISSDFAESCDLIHRLGGLVTVHAGTKANTIEELRNSDLFRQIQKKELTLAHVDIMELGLIQA
jgi:predicted metal-dependent phosphoesterase TrpH